MLYLFYVFFTLLLIQGLFSLLEGIRYLAFVRRSLGQPPEIYSPRATVMIPCKGLDVGLEENLRSLFNQRYPDYEIIFVVATEEDEALPVIHRVMDRQPVGQGIGNSNMAAASRKYSIPEVRANCKAKVVIAGRSNTRSEKVNNLLRAIEQAAVDSEVFVFADSDTQVASDWLRALVAPLADKAVGATTGYRWYVPERGGFFSALLSAWNGSVATTLGDHPNNFAWGGSMAILKSTFAESKVREAWEGAVSDDYALTRSVKRHGFRIAFVPRCMTVTRQDASLAALLEFTTRQVIITRVYNLRLWLIGLISQLLFNTIFFGGIFFALVKSIAGEPPVVLLVLLAFVYLLGSLKGVLRLLAAREMLPRAKSEISRLWWMYCLFWWLVSLVYLFNFGKSAKTRQILWRGVLYEMRTPTETRVVR